MTATANLNQKDRLDVASQTDIRKFDTERTILFKLWRIFWRETVFWIVSITTAFPCIRHWARTYLFFLSLFFAMASRLASCVEVAGLRGVCCRQHNSRIDNGFWTLFSGWMKLFVRFDSRIDTKLWTIFSSWMKLYCTLLTIDINTGLEWHANDEMQMATSRFATRTPSPPINLVQQSAQNFYRVGAACLMSSQCTCLKHWATLSHHIKATHNIILQNRPKQKNTVQLWLLGF